MPSLLSLYTKLFKPAGAPSFLDQLSSVCMQWNAYSKALPVRFVLFTDIQDNETYRTRFKQARALIEEMYPENTPVFTLVAQAPVDGSGLVLEVHYLSSDPDWNIQAGQINSCYYLKVQGDEGTALFLGTTHLACLGGFIQNQAELIFEDIKLVMDKENLQLHQIIRQWNYIEHITGVEDGRQNYQQFNDARSQFYAPGDWSNGFPAATGIGTSAGGVIVDCNFLYDSEKVRVFPLDNPLQIAAHAYSRQVLLEGIPYITPTTPKFERAKAIVSDQDSFVYISGTAAIRGEHSLRGMDIHVQTQVTMENIEYLISEKNFCDAHGTVGYRQPELQSLRVYLKNAADQAAAADKLYEMLGTYDAVFLQADVCRDELLIEIEAFAS